ncbi:MAG: ferrochelatase [Pseudomonadota bacterium]
MTLTRDKKNERGILLINLGTPASPQVDDVRRYLGEFLMDPYVLDTPWLLRKLIVSAFILPFRPKNSAEAYAKIWTESGSPLLTISQDLASACAELLGVPVVLGMRYGDPSIKWAVNSLLSQGVSHVHIVPLYPHYADSTVTTSVEEAVNAIDGRVPFTVQQPFYDQPAYIKALAHSIEPALEKPWDHLLLSYHGLPERHLTRADPGSHCLSQDNCCHPSNTPIPAHETCYRHHVIETSRLLGQQLGLTAEQWSVSFQSRLGRLPWLTPYTDEQLRSFPAQGIKNLVVACPAFVVDNLETLEEIGLQGRETFMQAGGESLRLVPCLNAEPEWVQVFSELIGA